MIEARALMKSIKQARERAESLGCKYMGGYHNKDVIFVPKGKGRFNLSDDFVRVRVFIRNNRPTRNAIVIRKRTEFKETGKIDSVVLKEEFDTEKEALAFVKKSLPGFRKGFEYSREGWEYHLGDKRIFVEDITGYGPSMEVEAENEKELKDLLKKIGAVRIVNESVPEMMRKRLMGE